MGTSWLTIATVLATCVAVFGIPDHCRLEPEPGHCSQEEARWYYNLKSGTCVKFLYYGCGGNLNNFRTRGACLRACVGAEDTPSESKEVEEKDNPFIKVVKTVEGDESDVDFDRLHIDDENDLATLEQLIAQDNIPVEEVVPVKDNTVDEKPQEDIIKVTKTVENDESDVDFKKLNIKDPLERYTLENLMAQQNMEVHEIVDDENVEEKEEAIKDDKEIKIVDTVEDDKDIDLSKLNINDGNDKATLEQLLAQENLPVQEVIPVEEELEEEPTPMTVVSETEVDEDVDISKYTTDPQDASTMEDLLATTKFGVNEIVPVTEEEGNNEEGNLEITRVVENDDTEVDLDRMNIDNINDKAALEDLIAQGNLQVNEVIPVGEEKAEVEETEQTDMPFIKVVKTVDEDDSDIDFDRLHITDENDLATLEQLIAQDNIPVEEVFPVVEEEQVYSEGNIKIVEEVDDDSEVNLDKMNIDNINDKVALEDLMSQENLPVQEVVPIEDEKKGQEEEVEEQSERPYIKVVETVDEDETEVNFERLHIDDANDLATLEQLIAQDNIPVEEVIPVEEEEETNGKEEKEIIEKPFMKVVETVEDDDSDVDFDRLQINDANDLATLEQLIAQDNLPVEEVFTVEEKREQEGGNIEVVRIEDDDSDVNFDRMNIDNVNDKAALEDLIAQGNLPVREVVPVDEEEEEAFEKAYIKVVKTVDNDDSEVDLKRLHIDDENDLATLEQLLAQDNIPVEEVIPVEEEEIEQKEGGNINIVDVIENDDTDVNIDSMKIDDINDKAALEDILAQENLPVQEVVPVKEEETADKPFIKVVETVDNDDSDVDFERLHIDDANDMATLEQLIAQDNIPVEEIIPVEGNAQVEEQEGNLNVVEEIEDDDSPIDFEKMSITDGNDKAALEELLAQDKLPVREVVPAGREQVEESSDRPFIKVVETVEEDDTEVNFARLHIDDENDLATLEQLIAQDNIPVEEVIPVNEADEAFEDVDSDKPTIKVVDTIEDDESDIKYERLQIDNVMDKYTLDNLIAQSNVDVQEMEDPNEEEGKGDDHEDSQPEGESGDKPTIKVVDTIEDDSDISLDSLHIDNEMDKSTLEQLIAQGNLPVQEVEPVVEEPQTEGESEVGIKVVDTIDDDESDIKYERLQIDNVMDKYTLDNLIAQSNVDVRELDNPTGSEDKEDEQEKPYIKVVKTIDEDDTEVNFDRLHITDENDLATLEQLIAQDNIPVEEVVPVKEENDVEETDEAKELSTPLGKSNVAYDELERLRNKYKKSRPFQFMRKFGQKPRIAVFSKKMVEEVEETETTTSYLAPQMSKTLPHCCTHPVAPGPCNKKILQWHYDLKLKTCVTFVFGGCGGNRNRFDTIGDCLRKCGGVTRAPQPRMMARPARRPVALNIMPLINPYKALLTGMSSRMNPLMNAFNQRPGPDVTTTMPSPREGAASPKSAIFRIMFSAPSRPMSMARRPMPFARRNHDSSDHHHHPMTVNNYKKSSHMSHFAPRFHKEVVMAPETHDNRFQSHSAPNNRLTLVQVFVNKRGRGRGGSGRRPRGRSGDMRPMRGPMRSMMRAPTPPRWWPRFDPPIHFPRGEEEKDNSMETTTYPPDYPKWPKDTSVNLGSYGITDDIRDRFIEKDEEEERTQVGEPNYACLLPVEAGPCKALDEKWYFDEKTGQCTKFYYGGCRGNANRFDSDEECRATCMTTSPKPDETTPYPDDVIVVTENVYGVVGEMEDQNSSEETKEVVKAVDVAVTPDPLSTEETVEKVKEVEEPQTVDVVEEAEEVGRLQMSSEVEYIIIITVMALVGLIVIILVAFSIAHVSKRCRKGKKERIVEAIIASKVHSPDFPKLVYYGNTIVPPTQSPDVPDVHTLNKLEDNKEDV